MKVTIKIKIKKQEVQSFDDALIPFFNQKKIPYAQNIIDPIQQILNRIYQLNLIVMTPLMPQESVTSTLYLIRSFMEHFLRHNTFISLFQLYEFNYI